MHKLMIIIALTLLGAQASAGMRKCTGADGRVTYSDVACASNTTENDVKSNRVSSVDTSGMVAQSKKLDKQNSDVEKKQAAEKATEPKVKAPQKTDKCDPLKGRARTDCLASTYKP